MLTHLNGKFEENEIIHYHVGYAELQNSVTIPECGYVLLKDTAPYKPQIAQISGFNNMTNGFFYPCISGNGIYLCGDQGTLVSLPMTVKYWY